MSPVGKTAAVTGDGTPAVSPLGEVTEGFIVMVPYDEGRRGQVSPTILALKRKRILQKRRSQMMEIQMLMSKMMPRATTAAIAPIADPGNTC